MRLGFAHLNFSTAISYAKRIQIWKSSSKQMGTVCFRNWLMHIEYVCRVRQMEAFSCARATSTSVDWSSVMWCTKLITLNLRNVMVIRNNRCCGRNGTMILDTRMMMIHAMENSHVTDNYLIRKNCRHIYIVLTAVSSMRLPCTFCTRCNGNAASLPQW